MNDVKDATYFDEGGYLPEGTRCPWRKDCGIAERCQAAREEGLKNKYSCGLARAFAYGDKDWNGWIKINKTD